MVHPQDNIVSMRNKIYIATGIPPFRQHIITKDSAKNFDIMYRMVVGNTLVDTNIYSALQSTDKSDILLNIPIDMDLYNRREDITVTMNDMKLTLLRDSGKYMVR